MSSIQRLSCALSAWLVLSCGAHGSLLARREPAVMVLKHTGAGFMADRQVPSESSEVMPSPAKSEKDYLVERVLQRLTLHNKPDGSPVYVKHCRQAREGCVRLVEYYVELILQASSEYRLEPSLMVSIALHESSFNPNKRGSVGEQGVLQVHPYSPWGKKARKQCRLDQVNCRRYRVMAAAWALSYALENCPNTIQALGMYNSGVCRASRYGSSVISKSRGLRYGE